MLLFTTAVTLLDNVGIQVDRDVDLRNQLSGRRGNATGAVKHEIAHQFRVTFAANVGEDAGGVRTIETSVRLPAL